MKPTARFAYGHGLTPAESDAVLAALRLLARELEAGRVSYEDNDIGAILTNAQQHEGLGPAQIDAMCERFIG